jgi:NAD+ kinase
MEAPSGDAPSLSRVLAVADHLPPQRIALVVHPTRPIDAALATVERWSEAHGIAVVQPRGIGGWDRQVAPEGELAAGDLIVALGGDGTVLSALRASAAVAAPVLGAECGSVAALTAVTASDLGDALERVLAGDWTARRLPALGIEPDGAPGEWAINDFAVVRRRAAQVIADVSVDGELYVRLAGDGVVVATALGSTAYSMAAGGPVLIAGTRAIVCTPLAMHGGNAPPLVAPAGSSVRVEVLPSFAGFDVEIDGHERSIDARDFRLSLHHEKVTLVSFGEPGRGLPGLRARRLITDSPRVLAHHESAAR